MRGRVRVRVRVRVRARDRDRARVSAHHEVPRAHHLQARDDLLIRVRGDAGEM